MEITLTGQGIKIVNQFSKEGFLAELTQLQFSQNIQQCWKQLVAGIELCAIDVHEQSMQSDQLLTPFAAWWHSCCSAIAGRQIMISKLDFNGSEQQGEQDEFIELMNHGPLIIDLSGWRVNAGDEGQDVTFPAESYIKPGARIRINTRKKGEYSFNSNCSIWNNKGDIAYLYDEKQHLISSWCYGNAAHELVYISDIFYDGLEKRSEGDEYAVITNKSDHWVDLTAWRLNAGGEQDFIFPTNSAIAPHHSIRVYTNHVDNATGGFNFASKTAVWNNQGDTGKLLDSAGHLVSQYSYAEAN